MEFFRKLFLPITYPLDIITKYFKALVFIVIVILIFGNKGTQTNLNANLAKIYLDGPIMDASHILERLEEAENTKYQGVMLIINSPGGAVSPSIEIAQAVKRLNSIKPVVVYASGTLASGSYYSAIWASKIIANPGSMVGSIGVIMESPDVTGLLDKIGVKERSVTAGKYKNIGNPMSIWKDYEKAELQKVVNGTYNMFVSDVATARGLDIKNHTTFADAHIFNADGAKNVGLIDEVGTIYEASSMLQNLSGVKEPIYEELKEDEMDRLMNQLAKETVSQLVSHITLY